MSIRFVLVAVAMSLATALACGPEPAQPTPTPTPVVSACTIEARDYAMFVEVRARAIIEDLEAAGRVTMEASETPDVVEDPDWLFRLTLHLDSVRLQAGQMVSAPGPESLADMRADAARASGEMIEAVDLLAEGITELDPVKLDESFARMGPAVNQFRSLAPEAAAACS